MPIIPLTESQKKTLVKGRLYVTTNLLGTYENPVTGMRETKKGAAQLPIHRIEFFMRKENRDRPTQYKGMVVMGDSEEAKRLNAMDVSKLATAGVDVNNEQQLKQVIAAQQAEMNAMKAQMEQFMAAQNGSGETKKRRGRKKQEETPVLETALAGEGTNLNNGE